MIKNNYKKANGYFNLAVRANYIIWGVDNLKDYTHKMYLVVYREDCGKTIEKLLARIDINNIRVIKLSVENFNLLTGTQKAKIFAIKNKGLSEQIINILRGEDG